jgi:adenosylhomocysteine nucleosidase
MELASARRVAILAAMVPELAPVVRGLALRPVAGGARTYAGRAGAVEVVATVTTMGTRAAGDATRRLLDAYAVDHVVMLGVCGGIDRQLAIGELVAPELVVDEDSGGTFRPTPPGGAIARGTLLTTDRLHRDPAQLDALRSRGVVAVDMESAAVGAVAEARGIPWSVYRAVSDRAGDPDVDEELVAMSNPDGTARPAAVLRFVLRRPRRIVTLARLGAGLRAAVRSSTESVLAALRGA